jgi:hypothetical protein
MQGKNENSLLVVRKLILFKEKLTLWGVGIKKGIKFRFLRSQKVTDWTKILSL